MAVFPPSQKMACRRWDRYTPPSMFATCLKSVIVVAVKISVIFALTSSDVYYVLVISLF